MGAIESYSDMAKRGIYRIEIFDAWCKRCGICAAFCPEDVLEMVENKPRVVRPEKCTGCGLCEIRCPDFAISVKVEEQKLEELANPTTKSPSQAAKDDSSGEPQHSEKKVSKDEPKNSRPA